ncbi:MAG: TonB-dependent receptor, partial [Bacteroidales bacterium]|nr:TonB-dependent receptor [Bacteroidales bacterium]
MLRVFLFISLTGILCALNGVAQDAVFVVRDAMSGKAIPYVHVRFEALNGQAVHQMASDAEGLVSNPLKTPALLTVSCMGYAAFRDTVQPGKGGEILIRPAVLEMEAVVVTAQYTPRRADQSIYPVRVIGSAKISSKASNDLRDLLSDELSMRISQDGALGSNLSLRGLSGEHIKFLIDGVPVIGRMNGSIDLGQLNLNNVDHVEVIEGPMSVVYGSNALAGVVNIITRDNFPGQYRAGADVYLESVGTYNFGAYAASRHKGHAWSFSANRNFFSGWDPSGESRNQLWKPKRQYDAEVWHSWRSEATRLRTSFRYFHELLLNRGALLPPYFETAFDNKFHTRRWTARVEGTRKLGKDMRMESTAAWSSFRREKETVFKDLTTLTEVRSANLEDQDTSTFSSLMIRAFITRARQDAAVSFQAGTDINHEFGEGIRITEGRQDIGDYAAFASFQLKPWSRLEFQPGLRYGYNTRYSPPLVWSAHMKWSALEKLIIRASFSRGFRAPALKELYLYFVDINHNIQGNPDLQAEYSWNTGLSASLSGRKDRLNWSAELHLFQNDIENIITLAQSSGTLYTYVNVENYHTRGAELKGTLAWYPWLTLRPGISHTGRTSIVSTEEDTDTGYRFSTDLTFSASLRPGGGDWELSAFYKYTGRLPQYYLASSGKLEEGYISDYHTLDMSLSRSLLNRQLQFSAGVKN